MAVQGCCAWHLSVDRRRIGALFVGAVLIVAASFGVQPAAAATLCASVNASGTQGNGSSAYASLSGDGRYVVFYSSASNLVPDDTNGVADIFVHDNVSGATTRVSVDSSGTQANGASYYWSSISGDGRYIVFSSAATNLVSGDTNSDSDVFVHDMASGVTTRASVDSSGTEANNQSYYPSISSDGRYVAFLSAATNLVPGDSNSTWDVFVRDRTGGTTARASVDSSGTQGNGASYYPRISANGRYVTFFSAATNLFASDVNGDVYDILLRDLVANTTELVSVTASGTQGNQNCTYPVISSDGRYVAFSSSATNMVSGDTNGQEDIFLRDRTGGSTSRVSVSSTGVQANNVSSNAAISADGHHVALSSWATNLVADDTNTAVDAFMHHTIDGSTTRVSVDSSGTQANGASDYPSVSADGQHVAFHSGASNLLANDTNGTAADVFVRSDIATTPPAVVRPSTLRRTTHMALTGRNSCSAGRSYKLKLWLSPGDAPGSVRLSIKCVNHGRTVTSKVVRVRMSGRKGVYRFKPYYHGTWTFIARYPGGSTAERVFSASSARKTIAVE
jgi:hypothetical protein